MSASGSAGQLDVETDALPVGGGAMIMEGLLALASLGAYMVLALTSPAIGAKWSALVAGAATLIAPGNVWVTAFYAM